MKKINLGCGNNILDGWDNCDLNGPVVLDLHSPLPYEDDSVDFILAEHCVEHLSALYAFKLFRECYRVLKMGGVLRVAVPSAPFFRANATDEHLRDLDKRRYCKPDMRKAVEKIMVGYSHNSCWTDDLLDAALYAVGFTTYVTRPMTSPHRELRGVEGHWRECGVDIFEAETVVVEGIKP